MFTLDNQRMVRLAMIGLLLAGGVHARAEAAQITLNPSSVIGGSGSWYDNAYDVGDYSALHVVDGQTGTIDEPDPGSFWLGREDGPGGRFNEYFVIDLGQSFLVNEIDLLNTHNQQADDRATRNF